MMANCEAVGIDKTCINWLISSIGAKVALAEGVCDCWSVCIESQSDGSRHREDLRIRTRSKAVWCEAKCDVIGPIVYAHAPRMPKGDYLGGALNK